jgi:hypothetical protein
LGQVRKIKAGLVKISVNDFVGEDGNIFFDIDDGIMRLSDGTTPGGVPLSASSAEGGASTFRQLLDTPGSFADSANKFVKVNPQASALEFVDVVLFDGNYNSLSNLPVLNTFDPSSIGQSLVPNTDVAYDLGTSTKKWRDLYLSGNTIFLGNAIIRNVDGTVELPANAKVNGRKIPVDVRDLDDVDNLLSIGGVTSYNALTDKPVLFSGNYNDLINTPSIPADISDLTDRTNLLAGVRGDASYTLPQATNNMLGGIKIGSGLSINGSGVVSVTAGVTSYNDLTDAPDLTVYQLTATAFSGSYTALTDKPVLFDGAYSSLTGLPTLFSGSYLDLTNKPTIPTVPTTISSFINDTGFITGYTVTQADVTQYQAVLSITESQISNLRNYLTSVAFADLTTTPTTLLGYGIIDAYTSTQVDSAISTAVNSILDGAPELLDTLNEIAAAVGDDPNFITTINSAVNLKANSADLAVVATSGSYTDLSNVPVIPTDLSDLTDNNNVIAASNITEDDLITYSILFG